MGDLVALRPRRAVPFYCRACSREYVSRWSHIRSRKHKKALAQLVMPWVG